ncbi:MAG: FAD-binding oxidoreductase [Pseudonocardia sp.]|nr:FAD-binding oxidoreductase [Pseudonocardia sp.]
MTTRLRDVDELRASLTGPVVTRTDPAYEEVRTVWNGDIDRSPWAVARCRGTEDVAAALAFARHRGLEIAVRGGGHGMSGPSVVDEGLVIDLGLLNKVTVDPAARLAWCGGGATIAELDAATQAHGLAVPMGTISHTGVGGLTLGGGMGWLTARHGLAIDNLEAAEVVLADGRVVRARAAEHPDLFWALRGGGGNFGVVTTFEYRLHPVGPEVHLGLLFWNLDRGRDALHAVRDLVPTLPRDYGVLIAAAVHAPPAPFVPEQYRFAPGHVLFVAGFGSAEEHAAAIAPFRRACPPSFEFVSPLPYTALQQLIDDTAPWGVRGYEKAIYLPELTDDAIDVVARRAPEKTSPMSFLPMIRLAGAYSAVGEADTAFGGSREDQYAVSLAAICPEPEGLMADRAWVRALWDDLLPLAAGPGSYVNFMTEYEADRVRASYGTAKYERLAQIKGRYDPGNLFHRNANIKPA